MKKVNIGCGLNYREGYINIDVREEVKPDIVLDLEECKLPFGDGEVSEIIAHDIIEHVSFRKVRDLFIEFNRVLKIGGQISIRVPDIRSLAKNVMERAWSYWEIGYWFYGAQDYPQNIHKSGFTFEALASLLTETGFVILEHKKDNSNLIVLAEKFKNLK